MSHQYLYKCSMCGHSICTDDAGCECTFGGISYLYYCEECHTLAKRITPPPFREIDESDVRWYCEDRDITPVSLSISPSILKSRIDDKQAFRNVDCPICGSRNIHKWNPISCGCPKCGGEMIKEEGFCIHTD